MKAWVQERERRRIKRKRAPNPKRQAPSPQPGAQSHKPWFRRSRNPKPATPSPRANASRLTVLNINVQRFRGGLVFKALGLCVSLNFRLESNKEEEKTDRVVLVSLDERERLLARKPVREREFFIHKLLVRIHLVIVMIRWTGLAPWEIEFPFQVALHIPSYTCSKGRRPMPLRVDPTQKVTSGGASWMSTGASKSLYWTRPTCI